MREPAIALSEVVLAKAAVNGDHGRGWAEALPDMLSDLQNMWTLQVGGQLTGATSAYVATATTESGRPAVVRIAVPSTDDFPRAVHTLDVAGGRGYVRLLDHDLLRRAMLLEPLGMPLNRTGYTPDRQLATVAGVLPQIWALPRDHRSRATRCWAGEPVDKAPGLIQPVAELWQQLDHPCPERVIRQAIDFAHELSEAFSPDRTVILHGDAATANLLQVTVPRAGAEAGFVFVDPSTFVGDPAYDLGVAMRDWCTELLAGDAPSLARRLCRGLAAAAGADEVAVWQWGYLERVSTGLYSESLGGDGRPHLLTADLLYNTGPSHL